MFTCSTGPDGVSQVGLRGQSQPNQAALDAALAALERLAQAGVGGAAGAADALRSRAVALAAACTPFAYPEKLQDREP